MCTVRHLFSALHPNVSPYLRRDRTATIQEMIARVQSASAEDLAPKADEDLPAPGSVTGQTTATPGSDEDEGSDVEPF